MLLGASESALYNIVMKVNELWHVQPLYNRDTACPVFLLLAFSCVTKC